MNTRGCVGAVNDMYAYQSRGLNEELTASQERSNAPAREGEGGKSGGSEEGPEAPIYVRTPGVRDSGGNFGQIPMSNWGFGGSGGSAALGWRGREGRKEGSRSRRSGQAGPGQGLA